jgi:hypothetical protein
MCSAFNRFQISQSGFKSGKLVYVEALGRVRFDLNSQQIGLNF